MDARQPAQDQIVGTAVSLVPVAVFALGPNATLTYVSLRSFCDGEGRAWPGVNRIAERVGISPRAARIALRQLVDAGWVDVQSRHREDGGQTSNLYVVRLDTPLHQVQPPLHDVQPPPAPGAGHELGPEELGVDLDLALPLSERTSPTTTIVPGATDTARSAERLCSHLRAGLIANGCRPPTVTKSWLDAAERLMRIDGKTEPEIMRCIDWTLRHEFWSTNVLSMPTLRRQWDRLELTARREKGRSTMGRSYDSAMASLAQADAELAAAGMTA